MIIDWLAPAAALALCARLLWMGIKEGWSLENALKTGGTIVLSYFMIVTALGLRHEIGVSLVFSTITLTMAVIPERTVLRLIRAKRPSEIEDPELSQVRPLDEERRSLEPPRDD